MLTEQDTDGIMMKGDFPIPKVKVFQTLKKFSLPNSLATRNLALLPMLTFFVWCRNIMLMSC